MDELAFDRETLSRLVDRYRGAAESAGVDIESVTIGEALAYLETGTLSGVPAGW